MESTSKSPKQDLVRNSPGIVQERASPVDNLLRPISVASEQTTMSVESETLSDITAIAKAGPASYKKNCAKNKSKTWEASYNKVFVCRLCNKHCKTRGNINLHFKKHRILVNRNREVFKKYCTIDLKKADRKPNITGNKKTVVMNQDRIVCHEGKMHYYVLYTLNDKCKEVDLESDSSEDFAPRFQRKRRRLLSKSSDDTVILNDAKPDTCSNHEEETKPVINNDKEAKEPKVMECIDLDDSSDESVQNVKTMSSTSKINLKTSTDNKRQHPNLMESKTIISIVTVCQNRYSKNTECSEEQEKQLASNKSKLLNIGLKAIFQQGHKSTGLLRYLEHAILEIKWMPTNASLRTQSKENKYVRIMPRIKGKEDISQDDMQFQNITNFSFISIKEEAKPIQVQKWKSMPIIETLVKSNTSTSSVVNGHSTSEPSISECAVLYCKTTIDPDKKLLNASPVANPKQLPKKVVPASAAPTVTEAIVFPSPVALDDANDFTNEDNDNLCMPIITSTTSLAQVNYLNDTARKDENNPISNSNNMNAKSDVTETVEKSTVSSLVKSVTPSSKPAATITPAPRIKVKNVAELMSEQALSQQNATNTTQSSIWLVPLENTLQNQVISASVNNGSLNGGPTLALANTSSQMIGSLNSVAREYVILDTVEMPNTKTSSPFKYLQTLMNIHNINLLNGTEQLSHDFICLIKFKLQFSQQSIHKPVVLCLSLHCLGNKFFLGVRDPNHPGNIDLTKLSANWQWEILKIYTIKDLVIKKLYQNAQKINPTLFEHVKNFVSILQTIKLKTSI